MLLNRSIEFGEKNHIKFANGKISIKNISLNVYCYAIDGVLIDTGPRSLLKQLQPFFLEADIDQVVITHVHEDHSGCASMIEQQRNLPIYIDEKSVNECKRKGSYPLYRKVFWGVRKPFHPSQLGKTFASRNATWDVISTPGHAFDHNAFLNRETGQLFSGDLFVQPKTKIVLREESIPTIIESIKHLLTYDFDEMYCSHAGFVENGRKMLEFKKQYLEEIENKVITLYQEGYSPDEIEQSIFKKKYPVSRISKGEWDSLHIVTSILENPNRKTEKSILQGIEK